MRIAYLSTFHPYRGGIAQFNARLMRELEHQGQQVSPFTFSRQYPDLLFPGKTQLVTADDHQADAVNAPRVLDSISPFSWLSAAKRIGREQPDLLLMKYWMTFFGPSLGTVAGRLKAKGTKVISILDNVVPHEGRFFDKPFTRYFLERNHGFIAMSAAVQRDLLALRPDA
ncbi:MAG TPA: glycosyltransferase, partial [Flavobacteriales bacterium]|nr:glycosyltransferase [Flavobacteriales bacterium]